MADRNSNEMRMEKVSAGLPTPPTAVQTASRRWVFLSWWLPATLITGLALGQVLYLRALVDRPRQLTVFYYLFSTQELAAAWCWAVILTVAAAVMIALPKLPSSERLTVWLAHHTRPIGLAVLALLLAGTQFVYRSFPLSMDEYAVAFQAQIFAAGELTGSFPPGAAPRLVPPFFLDYFFYSGNDGRIVASYWPAYSLLMAPFARIGASWMLNPILTVGTFWWLASLARRLCGSASAAGWTALLCLASPVFWINGISFYSMPAHLFFNIGFARLLLSPTGWRLPLAGLLGSVALTLHQPLPHLLFALPWGIWLLHGRGGLARVLWVGLGYLPLSLLLGVGWLVLRHDVQAGVPTAGDSVLAAPANGDQVTTAAPRSRQETGVRLPFVPPSRSVIVTRSFNLSKEWLWDAPALPLLAVYGAWAIWKRRIAPPGRTWLLLFGASAATTLLGYLFVPFDQGHGWGFRYFFPAWAALPLLAATWLSSPTITRASAVPAAMLAAALLAVPIGNALRAHQVRSFVDAQRVQAPPLNELSDDWLWVVFLDPLDGYYRGDLVRNDPFLRGNVWMMVSRGRQRDENLLRALFAAAELAAENRGDTVWRVPLNRPEQPSREP